jgi:2-C-methyl-D-erythritol 4-phosphate cytidylyltransferase
MIYAVILATGEGKRMGNAELPKQFMELCGKPIVIHTMEQFLVNPRLDHIVICCSDKWIDYLKNLSKEAFGDEPRLHFTVGGETRNESLINGCAYITENLNGQSEDIVVTHDAVRPFVSQKIIDDNIEAMEHYDAIDTAVEATDTIVYSEDQKSISQIPVRSNCFQGQTPQTFRIGKLTSLYNELTDDEKLILTDACKIYTIKGQNVGIVLGDVYNIKITVPYDLLVSNAIIALRN